MPVDTVNLDGFSKGSFFVFSSFSVLVTFFAEPEESLFKLEIELDDVEERLERELLGSSGSFLLLGLVTEGIFDWGMEEVEEEARDEVLDLGFSMFVVTDVDLRIELGAFKTLFSNLILEVYFKTCWQTRWYSRFF